MKHKIFSLLVALMFLIGIDAFAGVRSEQLATQNVSYSSLLEMDNVLLKPLWKNNRENTKRVATSIEKNDISSNDTIIITVIKNRNGSTYSYCYKRLVKSILRMALLEGCLTKLTRASLHFIDA